jgi:superfamily II DNA or RNA helicase
MLITRMGYGILKESLTPIQSQVLRKELTVAPAKAGKFAQAGDPFSVYVESPTRLYVPRAWGLAKYGPTNSTITSGDQLREGLVFTGTPYDYQTAIVNQFIREDANGLICVPCGRGKTFMAIAIAARIGRKFLIVVDKEFLLQQWSGELKALMPGIRIGIIQEHKKEIHSLTPIPKKEPTIPELKIALRSQGLPVGGTRDILLARLATVVAPSVAAPPEAPDCCIAMIQTLVQRDFAETDFHSFGFTIFDECHHLGAAHFSRALLKVQTKHMLGLSATPIRDDGLTKVFEWFLGKPVYWEKQREADPDVIVKKISFDTDDPEYKEVPVDFRGETVLARLLTQVISCEARNEVIDGIMKDLVAEPKRRILVLSDRKVHLERIERGLPAGTTSSYYIGGMKEEVREEGARTSQVLLGTYAMASEAMNIKTLNAMVMVSPRKKIEQSTGRILRTRKDERQLQPLIIDIVDSHDVYQGQWLKRRAYYKKCAYKIETVAAGAAGAAAAAAQAPEAPQALTNRCLIMD